MNARALLLGSVLALSCAGSAPVDVDPIREVDASASGDARDDAGPRDATSPDDVVDATKSDASASDTRAADAVNADAPGTDASGAHAIETVWVIVEENHSWASIRGSSSAPYINKTLLPIAAHAEQYYTPPGNHPSEPNYIWLEAGDNLGITNDDDPSKNHQSTNEHLVAKLQAAGISWRSYQEDMPDPTKCPLVSSGLYGAKHNPMVFFDDVTNARDPLSKNCLEHVKPFPQLLSDLSAGTIARYNFITPNLCNDMHGQTLGTSCLGLTTDLIKRGDDWLAALVPKIMSTEAYKTGGAIFIVWDEGDEKLLGDASDGPIGLLVVSPFAKKGASNTVKYTHSSLLRTLQDIFGVGPYLRDAAKATNLADLFTTFP